MLKIFSAAALVCVLCGISFLVGNRVGNSSGVGDGITIGQRLGMHNAFLQLRAEITPSTNKVTSSARACRERGNVAACETAINLLGGVISSTAEAIDPDETFFGWPK